MSARKAPTSSAPVLSIVPAALGDLSARLVGHTLYLNPTASAEDQLDAVADAVRFLQTGRVSSGRQVRHLRLVAAGGAR